MLQGHLTSNPNSDISEQRPAMTQQTAEPSSFLPQQGFLSGLPKHPRFGPCCVQQSPPVGAERGQGSPGRMSRLPPPSGASSSSHARIISEAAHCLHGAVPSSCPRQAGRGLGLPRTLILSPVAFPHLPVLPVNGGPLLAVGPGGRRDTEDTQRGPGRDGPSLPSPPATITTLPAPPATILSPSGHSSG